MKCIGWIFIDQIENAKAFANVDIIENMKNYYFFDLASEERWCWFSSSLRYNVHSTTHTATHYWYNIMLQKNNRRQKQCRIFHRIYMKHANKQFFECIQFQNIINSFVIGDNGQHEMKNILHCS